MTAQADGLSAEIVSVEVDISHGLNSFSIIGLGDRSINEAKDRISAAIKNSGFVSPKQKNQKVIISLAPAGSPKEGPSFDLAMAIGYLVAAEHIKEPPRDALFLGETALSGHIRRCASALTILCSERAGLFSDFYIPTENEPEGQLALEYARSTSSSLNIYLVSTLNELLDHLSGNKPLARLAIHPSDTSEGPKTDQYTHLDISDIKGNERAKRALTIAVAGFHHAILCGPPGTGKTILSQSAVSICPDLCKEHLIEVANIYSTMDSGAMRTSRRPPFRAPHHTSSYAAILGGGPGPRPGEISLAHRGILFLDEFPEFSSLTLEGLRQPIECGSITVSRAGKCTTFPSQCLLIAAMNPCPCGRGVSGGCTCSHSTTEKYRRRISGPIADRFDLWIPVDSVERKLIVGIPSDNTGVDAPTGVYNHASKDSSAIRTEIQRARTMQRTRFLMHDIDKHFNSEATADDIDTLFQSSLSAEGRQALDAHARTSNLSGRALHRTLKVARTIADLASSEAISEEHILEALSYRKKSWT